MCGARLQEDGTNDMGVMEGREWARFAFKMIFGVITYSAITLRSPASTLIVSPTRQGFCMRERMKGYCISIHTVVLNFACDNRITLTMAKCIRNINDTRTRVD